MDAEWRGDRCPQKAGRVCSSARIGGGRGKGGIGMDVSGSIGHIMLLFFVADPQRQVA